MRPVYSLAAALGIAISVTAGSAASALETEGGNLKAQDTWIILGNEMGTTSDTWVILGEVERSTDDTWVILDEPMQTKNDTWVILGNDTDASPQQATIAQQGDSYFLVAPSDH